MSHGSLDTHRQAWIDLAHAVEPGDARVGAWVEKVGAEAAAAAIARGSRADAPMGVHLEGMQARWRASGAQDAQERAQRLGGRIITRADTEWPSQLADLGHAEPNALWLMGAGSLRLLSLRSISMVGARACTAYGVHIARTWAGEFAERHWAVTSGGALGIDGAAHRGALESGGTTIAVLACGVDVTYPRTHDALFASIADSGLLVSEVPLGEGVRRQRFLARNRLIATLTRATVVVEAALRSGTRATARHAATVNRPVLAVPGPVTSPASAGCHRMIRDNEAHVAGEWSDVIDLLTPITESVVTDQSATGAADDEGPRAGLDPSTLAVLDALPARGIISVEVLVARTARDRMPVLSALGRLEGRGLAENTGSGWRLVRKRA